MTPREYHVENDRYIVRAAVHSVRVLQAFQPAECLRLRDIVERTGLAKGVAFRMLQTLVHCRIVARLDRDTYLRRHWV